MTQAIAIVILSIWHTSLIAIVRGEFNLSNDTYQRQINVYKEEPSYNYIIWKSYMQDY